MGTRTPSTNTQSMHESEGFKIKEMKSEELLDPDFIFRSFVKVHFGKDLKKVNMNRKFSERIKRIRHA